MLKYAARHYDDRLQLKIPPMLWVILFYGVRHGFVMAASRLMPSESLDVPWITLQAHAVFLWCDLPAWLVLLATGHRVPNALPFMRWVWHHGRQILIAGYALGMATFVAFHGDALVSHELVVASTGIILTDLAAMLFLWHSRLLRDLFAEFPEPSRQGVAPVGSLRELSEELQHERRQRLLAVTVLKDLPDSVEITTISEGLMTAATFESHSRSREAEAVYRCLLSRWTECADAWHAYGLLAYQAGRREHGLALVEEAMRLDGKSAIYRRNACEMLRRMERLDEAIRYGQMATRLAPEDAEAWHYLGMALTNAGRYREAVDAYRRVLVLRPRHVKCWNNLAVALQADGQYAEAEKAYLRALELDASNVEARSNLRKLLSKMGR